MASAWGKAFGAAFGAAWGLVTESVVNPQVQVKRRSGLGSLKINYKTLPIDLPHLEELFEIDEQPVATTIRARNKRDEFLILH